MLKLRENINRKVALFDDAIRRAKSDRVAEILFIDKKRWLCRNDLYYLCCVTGNENIKKWPQIYQPFCDEVSLMNWLLVYKGVFKAPMTEDGGMLTVEQVTDDPENDLWMERLWLCYRAYYKTTIITINHSVQLLLNFPNIHIALVHNKAENASDNLIAVKNCFLTTPIRRYFHEYIPKGKDWGNRSGLSVAARTDWKDPGDNIEAVGVGTEITGKHWNVAKKNDIETQDSVNTEEQIKKTRDWDNRFNVGHFYDAKLKIQDYEGTRYGFTDLYSVKKADPNIKLTEIPLEKNGVPLHPDRYTVMDVEKIKGGMAPWVYNCQMQLSPEDPAKITFSKQMIQYYTKIPRGCKFYVLVDPAGTRKKGSDYTVILVVGVDSINRKYVVDGVRDKLDPKGRVDMTMEKIKHWSPQEVGYEEVGLADDTFYLEERRRKENSHVLITPIKTAKVAKVDRIRNILVPQYAKLEWFWPEKGEKLIYSKYHGRNFDLTEEMELELLQFPLGEHDDLLDAMTFLSKMNVILPTPEEDEDRNRPMTFGDLHKMMDERKNGKVDVWEGIKYPSCT